VPGTGLLRQQSRRAIGNAVTATSTMQSAPAMAITTSLMAIGQWVHERRGCGMFGPLSLGIAPADGRVSALR